MKIDWKITNAPQWHLLLKFGLHIKEGQAAHFANHSPLNPIKQP